MSTLASLDSPLVCLLRHGETPFSAARRYNGITDAPLTESGEVLARRLQPILSELSWDKVLSSNLSRARRTAELAGFADPEIKPVLRECDYGAFEGKTTEEIFAERPGWDFWRDGCPDGESAELVAKRLRPLIDDLRQSEGRTLIFSHSHAIRIFAAEWLDLGPRRGAIFESAPAHINALGIHRGHPVVRLWNDGSTISMGGAG